MIGLKYLISYHEMASVLVFVYLFYSLKAFLQFIFVPDFAAPIDFDESCPICAFKCLAHPICPFLSFSVFRLGRGSSFELKEFRGFGGPNFRNLILYSLTLTEADQFRESL